MAFKVVSRWKSKSRSSQLTVKINEKYLSSRAYYRFKKKIVSLQENFTMRVILHELKNVSQMYILVLLNVNILMRDFVEVRDEQA